MSEAARRAIIWTPRILTIAFAAFLSVFAADVFDEPLGLGMKALALAIHLIPTGIVLVGLALAWKREWIATLVFPLLALWHIVSFWGRFPLSVYLAIDGPLIVVAALFLASWLIRTGSPRADGRPSLG